MPYIGVSPQFGVRRKHTYTATAGQTSFSGAGSEGATLSYTDSNFVDVYQNGVKLGDADYTSTSGTAIVLAQGASVDDLVEIIVFDAFSAADTVSKADGGQFDGNITMAGTLATTGNATFSGEIITSTSGTSNVRIGENAGDAIASGGNYNTVVGDEAGTAITTGDGNTAVGFEALKTEDAHGFNTAVGYQTLKMQNAGAEGYNVAVGHQAGTAITTGIANVIVGALAGDAMTTGQINVLVGTNTGSGLTEGLENVAMGHNSLLVDTKGQRSTALGYGTLAAQNFTSLTEVFNTAVGFNAGAAVTTGVKNTIIGGLAGDVLTDADFNVAVGYGALSEDHKGNKSTAIGAFALEAQEFTSSSDTNNTGVGYQAGASITTGPNNSCFGANAGDAITTGNANICLGGHAGSDITTANNNIMIGYAAGSYNNDFTTGSQNVCIGNYIIAGGNADDYANALGYNLTAHGGYTTLGKGTDDIRASHGSTTWSTVSDERYKKDIEDAKAGLSFINALKPRTFKYKTLGELPKTFSAYKANSTDVFKNDNTNHGFIAQEVKQVIDADSDLKDGFKLWDERGDGSQEIAETALIPMLVKAIQELSAEVKALKGE